jgi:hypothetical protein
MYVRYTSDFQESMIFYMDFPILALGLLTIRHMETAYYITLNIKTGSGYESFGKFCIGSDKTFAENIFKKLKGSNEVTERNILHMDLVAMRNELPLNVHMISCTLEELTENCRIITCETFKLHNLEQIR